MNNPLKSILVEGELSQDEIKYLLCPDYFQLQSGVWELAISTISISSIEVTKKERIFNISTNLVQGHCFHKSQLTKFNVILHQFKVSPSLKKDIVYANGPLWFVVNNSGGDYLTIYLKEWPTKVSKQAEPKVLVSINVLFRRIV